jgi:phenylalanyl-tRNA synthetase alpha chain
MTPRETSDIRKALAEEVKALLLIVADPKVENADAELSAVTTRAELEEWRVKYVGAKGHVALLKRRIGEAGPQNRKALGRHANAFAEQIERCYRDRVAEFDAQERNAELAERLDVTLPGRRGGVGRRHPLTTTSEDILAVLASLGLVRAEGPEVEHDFYNFEALNIPRDHPARDMQDTFYVDDDVVLRTHTSPVQIRAMLALGKPPIRVACFGRVYRNDSDVTHSPMFHQVEGLYVDTEVTFGDLKGTLQLFAEKIFARGVKIRLRPSFFPFTEPSVEVDVSCFSCGGSGRGGATVTEDGACRLCKATGFIEIMGAGMVDPEVLKFGKLDPDNVSGFAFGIGVERVAMLRYGVSDIRLFFENDRRFLKQF